MKKLTSAPQSTRRDVWQKPRALWTPENWETWANWRLFLLPVQWASLYLSRMAIVAATI